MLERALLGWWRLAANREKGTGFRETPGADAGVLAGDPRADLEAARRALGALREEVSRGLVGLVTREALGAALAEVAGRGERFTLVGIGTWETRERSARTGRNPKTGESIRIPGRRVLTFKAARGLKDALEDPSVRVGRHPGSLLAMRLSEALGCGPSEAADGLQVALQAVVDALRERQVVRLPGFGRFEVKTRPERRGRNPQTGDEIVIRAAIAVSFTARKGVSG